MSYKLFGSTLMIAVCGGLLSCKSVREVTSIESKGISDPLSDRFIGSSVSKYESGARHSMDNRRTTTKKIFGGTQENLLFGGKYKKKMFQGSKKSSYANNQFDPDNYYFARPRERKNEKALIANNQFDKSNKKANEGSRNWLGRRKKVKTQRYQDSKKLVPSRTFQQAVDDNGKNINNKLEIINRPGTQNAPQGMSIDDVKRLLGN